MAQIQYITLTNQAIGINLTDESGNSSTLLSDNLFAGAPVTISSDHHEIHCGDMFMNTRAVDLGNGASDTILLVVPNETGTPMKQYHMLVSYSSEAETQFDMYENSTLSATTSATGTSLTNWNHNRNSSLSSSLIVSYSPVLATSGGDGTKIFERHAGSRSVGSEARGKNEIILRNNTKYVLRLTNATTSNNYISWELNHYIHPGV